MKIYRISNDMADRAYDRYQDGILRRDIVSLIHRLFRYDKQIQNNLLNVRPPFYSVEKTKQYTRAIPIHRIDIDTRYNEDGLIQLIITIIVALSISMSDKNNAANTAIRIVQSGDIHKKIEELTGVYPEIKLLGDPIPK